MNKFKAFAEDKFNVAKMTTSLCDRVENTVGKEENAGCSRRLIPSASVSLALTQHRMPQYHQYSFFCSHYIPAGRTTLLGVPE